MPLTEQEPPTGDILPVLFSYVYGICEDTKKPLSKMDIQYNAKRKRTKWTIGSQNINHKNTIRNATRVAPDLSF
jgi:hypothetical protein